MICTHAGSVSPSPLSYSTPTISAEREMAEKAMASI